MARNYKSEYARETGERKTKRAARNRARYSLMKQGRVKKGDGKDVAHKKPLSKGGTNEKSNLKVASRSKNRSFPRTKRARMA